MYARYRVTYMSTEIIYTEYVLDTTTQAKVDPPRQGSMHVAIYRHRLSMVDLIIIWPTSELARRGVRESDSMSHARLHVTRSYTLGVIFPSDARAAHLSSPSYRSMCKRKSRTSPVPLFLLVNTRTKFASKRAKIRCFLARARHSQFSKLVFCPSIN